MKITTSGSFGLLTIEPSTSSYNPAIASKPFSLKDLIGNGIFWAVPKSRRTIEVRMRRRYGSPYYQMKTLQPKTHLRICENCGHHHEVGILCAHCYDKVRKETALIKEKIEAELKLDIVESEVVVLYDGEKGEHGDEYWKGKRIIEMEKPRPMWFSKNLLQKTTQPLATTKEVKPEELG